MVDIVRRLPADIVFHHIIPYTYSPQPAALLNDLCDYTTMKSIVIENPITTYNIQNELSAWLYLINPSILLNILQRRFMPPHYLQVPEHVTYQWFFGLPTESQFNIIFGLLRNDERRICVYYVE
jgi:hypothetical protein